MKRIILAVTLVSLALSFAIAQDRGSTVSREQRSSTGGKTVEVTARTLAAQPAGEPYVIDLTRKGTVYNVAAGIDYSRVRVRTPAGELALSDLAKGAGGGGEPFLLGTFSDLSARDFGFPPDGDTSTPPDEVGTAAAIKAQLGGGLYAWACKGKRIVGIWKGPANVTPEL